MPDAGGEKTEAPTPRKLAESREQGQVAKSQDLTAAVALLGGLLLLGVFGEGIMSGFAVLVRVSLSGEWSPQMTGESAGNLLAMFGGTATRALAPMALAIFALGIVANIIQFGFVFSLKAIQPKPDKISPIKGAQNLFSKRSVMRLVMSLGKVFIVLAVAGMMIYFEMERIMALAALPSGAILAASSMMVFKLAIKIGVVLILLAILDFAYQKWQFHQDQKMTKEEVKEELKRMEGDPLVKQRRARVARQLAMQRMGQAVPSADVVVTNPTHFAIALKYEEGFAAPKVVAKGADLMAMRIRQLAVANGVPIVERPPLARALYRYVDVGEEIPEKYYSAVAEILAYVYRISDKSPAALAG